MRFSCAIFYPAPAFALGVRQTPVRRLPEKAVLEQLVGLRATARCVLYYNTILARGPAARPRCIPPASGSFRALNPFQSHKDRIADQSLAGEFALPAPIDPFRMTMELSRPLEPLAALGDVPLHLHRTMHERLAVRPPPFHEDQPFADWMRAMSWRRASSRPGRKHFIAALALEPSLRPWGVPAPVDP